MKRIRHIRVLGFNLPVLYVNADKDDDLKGDRGTIRYPTDGRSPYVKIDRRLSPQEQIEAIWHECTHALDIETCGGRPRERLTEGQTTRLCRAQVGILRDNPQIYALLGARLE